MRRSIRATLTLAGALAVAMVGGCAITPPGDPGALEDLTWLTGAWRSEEEPGTVTEEFWTPAEGGTMFGVSRVITGGRTVFFEHLRLEITPQGLVYLASPAGRQPPTSFYVVERGDRFVFENPKHDWPQRVIYRRDGRNGLVTRVEGVDDGIARAGEWQFRRR